MFLCTCLWLIVRHFFLSKKGVGPGKVCPHAEEWRTAACGPCADTLVRQAEAKVVAQAEADAKADAKAHATVKPNANAQAKKEAEKLQGA